MALKLCQTDKKSKYSDIMRAIPNYGLDFKLLKSFEKAGITF